MHPALPVPHIQPTSQPTSAPVHIQRAPTSPLPSRGRPDDSSSSSTLKRPPDVNFDYFTPTKQHNPHKKAKKPGKQHNNGGFKHVEDRRKTFLKVASTLLKTLNLLPHQRFEDAKLDLVDQAVKSLVTQFPMSGKTSADYKLWLRDFYMRKSKIIVAPFCYFSYVTPANTTRNTTETHSPSKKIKRKWRGSNGPTRCRYSERVEPNCSSKKQQRRGRRAPEYPANSKENFK
jgi:hypothetical protein